MNYFSGVGTCFFSSAVNSNSKTLLHAIAAYETNPPSALITEYPKPAPRIIAAPVPKPRHTTLKAIEEPPEIVGVVLKDEMKIDDEELLKEENVSVNSSIVYQDAVENLDEINVKQEKSGGFKENRSVTSLKSVDSIPAFLGEGSMKKWTNFEDLDELSDGAAVVSQWEVGDTTDTGMFQLLLTVQKLLLVTVCNAFMLYCNVYI